MNQDLITPVQTAELLKALDNVATPVKVAKKLVVSSNLAENEYQFYKIDCLTHFSEEPRREALENVYSSIRFPGASFVYLLHGSSSGVNLYFGIARSHQHNAPALSVKNIADSILKPVFEGNFRGSKLHQVEEKHELLSKLERFKHVGVLQGAVGNQEQGENNFFQGMDRLVDVMLGQEFCLAITASAMTHEQLLELEQIVHQGYALFAPLSKMSYQQGKNSGEGRSLGESTTASKGRNYSKNTGESDSETSGTSKATSSGDVSDTGSEGKSKSTNSGESWGSNSSESKGLNRGVSVNSGESQTVSTEIHNRKAQQWLTYIDEVLLPRVDYGRSRGGFISGISLFATSHHSLLTLSNTAMSVFSGNSGNCYPLHFMSVSEYPSIVNELRNLQIPTIELNNRQKEPNGYLFHHLKSRLVEGDKVVMGTYCSPRELSLIAGLPQKEVAGIALNEEVNFGLNPPQVDEGNKLVLGELVQDGKSIPNNDVSLNISELNKHMFVAGVTGSGKTTTCHHLLREAKLPFLVIEPAKTEYRTLMDEFDDLLIFTPGRDELGAFRLNPLELMPGESISARVDILKASFAASFDMEAAIPQVLEAAIYRCYEKMGWNLTTSRHPEFPDPFAENVYPFPIMQDLLEASKEVVEEQGFDARLRDDYIGSIKARLQGLLVGSKKQIFNTLRSIDFAALLKRRVVIELEEIRNGAEKSLIMAFIMTNMVQALKNEHRVNPDFRHLTLIEEAHRLLAHPDPSESNNKKQAVEMFADMLAEIRKYGEGLIIVDQIPSKLTPEVLKSTNTKIVHKLFAQDDKDAIGNTIALEKDQKTYLSRLDVGHCVVFSQGWQKAVQVQVKVDPALVTQADLPLNEVEKVIRERFIEFCQLPTSRRLLPMLSHSGLSSISTKQQVSDLLKFSQETDLFFCWEQFLVEQNDTSKEKVVQSIKKAFESTINTEIVIDHLLYHVYPPVGYRSVKDWRLRVDKAINCLMSGEDIKVGRMSLDSSDRRKM
ncbi:DUF87 domain-containing protein [Vibrio sp. 10N.261.49.A5]|uniref:ATP-binding protein n=1 Tax=unclassified Vibrio TaxID=2614977 RepID=UPI0035542748